MKEGHSKEWFVLIRMKNESFESHRFGNVISEEPIDANQAWRAHRRKMTLEDVEHVTEVRAIQVEHMAKVNIA